MNLSLCASRFCFSIPSLLVIVLTFFQQYTPTLQAASNDSDPQVVILVDITTAEGPCTDTTTIGKGTSKEATKVFPCPSNSILQQKVVRLSEALALNEPNVLLSSLQSTDSTMKETSSKQLDQIRETKNRKGQQAWKTKHSALLTPCGQSSYKKRTSFIQGYSLYHTVWFYKTEDCSIAFDKTSLLVNIAGSGKLIWSLDKYYGVTFPTGCPTLLNGKTYSQ